MPQAGGCEISAGFLTPALMVFLFHYTGFVHFLLDCLLKMAHSYGRLILRPHFSFIYYINIIIFYRQLLRWRAPASAVRRL